MQGVCRAAQLLPKQLLQQHLELDGSCNKSI
jgi:hypothetical protein